MKNALFDKLGDCGAHGKFIGKECPLCEGGAVPQAVLDPQPVTDLVMDRSSWYPGPEKELHGLFESEMIRRGISYIHARTDQKSTIANGWPDFSCFYAAEDGVTRACFVELKNKRGRTSKDQDECIASLRKLNIPVIVSGNFREAVEFVTARLALKPKDTLPL